MPTAWRNCGPRARQPDIRTIARAATRTPMTLRLVLDTNVWLDWLVFDDADVAPIKAAVARGQAEIFIDAACEQELVRVLAYPLRKRILDVNARGECLAECRRVARIYPAPTAR